MKNRIREIGVAVALSLCVGSSAIHAQPKVKAKDVPTEQDRCVLSCDAKQRQCLLDGQPEEICGAEGDACRQVCGVPMPTPAETPLR
jgi:hypothetical protein